MITKLKDRTVAFILKSCDTSRKGVPSFLISLSVGMALAAGALGGLNR